MGLSYEPQRAEDGRVRPRRCVFVLNQCYKQKPFEKPIARAGTVPASMASLTNLEKLYLYGNYKLEKPSDCPVDGDGHMYYNSKEKVAAFLRCL